MDQNYYIKYGIEWRTSERIEQERVASHYKAVKIFSMIKELKIKKILDFGCGLGDSLNYFACQFNTKDAMGIDISPTMIEYAKEKYPEYKFICGNHKNLYEKKADLYSFLDVLEHLENISEVLQIAVENANYTVIKIPLEKTALISLLNLLHLRKKQSRLYYTEGHLHELNKNEVINLIQKAGLQIIKSFTCFVPRQIHFSDYMLNRMKTKKGKFAKLKYALYLFLSKCPYPLVNPLFRIVNGVDFFVLCKPGEKNSE